MDENPYKAPLEDDGPQTTDPGDWPSRLRRLAIGPRIGIAWLMLAVAVALLVVLAFRGWALQLDLGAGPRRNADANFASHAVLS
jgi:hypothetical protein